MNLGTTVGNAYKGPENTLMCQEYRHHPMALSQTCSIQGTGSLLGCQTKEGNEHPRLFPLVSHQSTIKSDPFISKFDIKIKEKT